MILRRLERIALGLSVLSAASFLASCDDSRPAGESSVSRDGTRADAEQLVRRACRVPRPWLVAALRGWRPGDERAADLLMIPNSPNYVGAFTNTSHSGPYPFLQKVPLTFYGPGFINPLGRYEPDREVTVADLAPTLAELLDLEWPERDGAPIEELLVPGAGRPRLVVTVTIDGGGWDVLEQWPDATPFLRRLMEEGANVDGARVGSSPSVTPAIHTTVSTGAFPRRHGVTGIAIRADDGRLTGPFSELIDDGPMSLEPTISLRMSTLGDIWDRAMGNQPEVGLMASSRWILGMLGQGAAAPGGDKDMAAILEGRDRWGTDPDLYSLPSYVNEVPTPSAAYLDDVDRADGAADGRWLGHDLSSLTVPYTPALSPWQVDVAELVLEREGYGQDEVTDLFYLHLKSPDLAGHRWNMIAPEQADMLGAVDSALEDLVGWLDREVGRDEYVVVVTADHGQTPLDAGGWAIDRTELVADLGRALDSVRNDTGIIERTSPTVLFSNEEEMKANEITPERTAIFLNDLTIGENNPEDRSLPREFEGRENEKIFRAVVPGGSLDEVADCAGLPEDP